MKNGTVYKAILGPEDTPEQQLALINRYTRRSLLEEELYVFSLVLCDNEVDRDYERFTINALHKLAELFEGTTGIFDHSPSSQNQTARIFKTAVETDPNRQTAAKEPYHMLRGWAYMVRCPKNNDLILEIDAGIKKEVSIGCSVSAVTCSVCGADRRTQGCSHTAGVSYGKGVGQKTCHFIMDQPGDAYEWSFVAVPAQPGAGVTKSHKAAKEEEIMITTDVQKMLLDPTGPVTLTVAQLQALGQELTRLEKSAVLGQAYLSDLQGDALRAGLLAQPNLDGVVLEKALSALDVNELKSIRAAFARQTMPLATPQLLPPCATGATATTHQAFKI